MTALAANTVLQKRNTQNMFVGEKVIATSSVLYIGAILVSDGTNNTVLPAADTTATKFEGIYEPLYGLFGASITGDGTLTARFISGCEVLLPCANTVDSADTGKAAYAADDGSVTDASTLGPQIGTFVEMVGTTTVWVALSRPVMLNAT